jgi:hypothetical protein
MPIECPATRHAAIVSGSSLSWAPNSCAPTLTTPYWRPTVPNRPRPVTPVTGPAVVGDRWAPDYGCGSAEGFNRGAATGIASGGRRVDRGR